MGKRMRSAGVCGVDLRDVLDRMGPDLRLLDGMVSLLRSLSETSDAVEPVALERPPRPHLRCRDVAAMAEASA